MADDSEEEGVGTRLRTCRKPPDTIREWEASGLGPLTATGQVAIEQAEKEFLADCAARKLKASTQDRYRILFRQLKAFAKKEGFQFLKQLDTPTLNKFRATWKGESGLADLKKLERLRSFFKFAMANGDVKQNPAVAMRNPKIRQNPTLPYSQEEMVAILAESAKRINEAKTPALNKARRLRGLALLLRYSGLRISDAVGCPADRLQDCKLFLYTQKTGQHVYCPLPTFVVSELECIPRVSERYWFWTGQGTVETSRKKWTEALTTHQRSPKELRTTSLWTRIGPGFWGEPLSLHGSKWPRPEQGLLRLPRASATSFC